jgi:hypothetical protein
VTWDDMSAGYDSAPCVTCGVYLSSSRYGALARECWNCRNGAPVEARKESQEMPSLDDIYGGNTLKAEDLPQNYRGVVTIESVSVQTFEDDKKGQERKLVVRFQGKAKGLALNVTNANMLAEITGTRDYDYWPGRQVVLYRTTTDYAGRRVPAIRLDHLGTNGNGNAPARALPPPPPPPPPMREPGEDFVASDDDVPF